MFSIYDENEDITPKEITKAVEDHENCILIIKDGVLVKLGTQLDPSAQNKKIANSWGAKRF